MFTKEQKQALLVATLSAMKNAKWNESIFDLTLSRLLTLALMPQSKALLAILLETIPADFLISNLTSQQWDSIISDRDILPDAIVQVIAQRIWFELVGPRAEKFEDTYTQFAISLAKKIPLLGYNLIHAADETKADSDRTWREVWRALSTNQQRLLIYHYVGIVASQEKSLFERVRSETPEWLSTLPPEERKTSTSINRDIFSCLPPFFNRYETPISEDQIKRFTPLQLLSIAAKEYKMFLHLKDTTKATQHMANALLCLRVRRNLSPSSPIEDTYYLLLAGTRGNLEDYTREISFPAVSPPEMATDVSKTIFEIADLSDIELSHIAFDLQPCLRVQCLYAGQALESNENLRSLYESLATTAILDSTVESRRETIVHKLPASMRLFVLTALHWRDDDSVIHPTIARERVNLEEVIDDIEQFVSHLSQPFCLEEGNIPLMLWISKLPWLLKLCADRIKTKDSNPTSLIKIFQLGLKHLQDIPEQSRLHIITSIKDAISKALNTVPFDSILPLLKDIEPLLFKPSTDYVSFENEKPVTEEELKRRKREGEHIFSLPLNIWILDRLGAILKREKSPRDMTTLPEILDLFFKHDTAYRGILQHHTFLGEHTIFYSVQRLLANYFVQNSELTLSIKLPLNFLTHLYHLAVEEDNKKARKDFKNAIKKSLSDETGCEEDMAIPRYIAHLKTAESEADLELAKELLKNLKQSYSADDRDDFKICLNSELIRKEASLLFEEETVAQPEKPYLTSSYLHPFLHKPTSEQKERLDEWISGEKERFSSPDSKMPDPLLQHQLVAFHPRTS